MQVKKNKKSLCLELGGGRKLDVSALCATAPLVFGKRGSIASFLCLEVLGLIVEMPVLTLKLQFLSPLLCPISISGKSNPCSK